METEEKIIWEGNPSQYINFSTFLLCGIFCWLVIPIFIAWWAYLKTKYTVIKITTERIILKQGILSKTTTQVEYYRIKDVVLNEPFLLRMMGLSNLLFVSSDLVEHLAPINGISDGERIREEIRKSVEEVRLRKKVFVRDV